MENVRVTRQIHVLTVTFILILLAHKELNPKVGYVQTGIGIHHDRFWQITEIPHS